MRSRPFTRFNAVEPAPEPRMVFEPPVPADHAGPWVTRTVPPSLQANAS
ncbi:hypothetical protein ACRBEV_09910 [Methylobacterium phyllosphaerae]